MPFGMAWFVADRAYYGQTQTKQRKILARVVPRGVLLAILSTPSKFGHGASDIVAAFRAVAARVAFSCGFIY